MNLPVDHIIILRSPTEVEVGEAVYFPELSGSEGRHTTEKRLVRESRFNER